MDIREHVAKRGGVTKGSQFPLKNPTQRGYAQFAIPPPTKLLTLEHFSYIKVTKIDHEEGLEIIGHSN